MAHSAFVIIKGEPKCLNRGFDKLKSNMVTKTIKTIEYEKKRKFQLVEIDEYDPVTNVYKNIGKHWADVVTGTLYDPFNGECLSSTQIRLLLD